MVAGSPFCLEVGHFVNIFLDVNLVNSTTNYHTSNGNRIGKVHELTLFLSFCCDLANDLENVTPQIAILHASVSI